jgi:redox-sensing transcriptional repressor
MAIEIPDVVIDRLPVYARALAALERSGREVVSSQELGSQLGVTPAQIRKDLATSAASASRAAATTSAACSSSTRSSARPEWTMVVVGVGRSDAV